MACLNHPEVLDGLDSCTGCGKQFCIDCLVGRQTGWYCATCDKAQAPASPMAGLAAGVSAAPPKPVAPLGGVMPAKPKPPPTGPRACANHPEVLERLNPCTRCGRIYCPDCLVELKGNRFCAGCKVDAVKDIQSGVDGSGIELAGLGARFAALLIDGFAINIIIVPIMIIMAIVIAAIRPGPDSMAMPIVVFAFYGLIFASIFCYHGIMLQWKGQTLGKMALKIKVVNPDGTPISAGQAWIRVLVWFLLHGCMIDYIPALFNKEKMAIHDMAARTRVVKIG